MLGELRIVVLGARLHMQIPEKYNKAVSRLLVGDRIYLRAKYEDPCEDRPYFIVHMEPKNLPADSD